MFHRLRMKLTVINASIMVLLFLLLIGGTYAFTQHELQQREQRLSERVMADIVSGRIQDLPHDFGPPHGEAPSGPPPGRFASPPPDAPPGMMAALFYVKTDAAGAVQFGSSNRQISNEELATLLQLALAKAEAQATLDVSNVQYSYLKRSTDEGGWIVLFHDLTQEKHMQQVLLTALIAVGAFCSLLSFGVSFVLAQGAMRPIQQSWQQQKELLSDVSHELRTPLAVIQTHLDIVRRKPEESVGSQDKWLANIQDECSQMTQLVNNLLFLARADAGQLPYAPVVFSITQLAEQAIEAFSGLASRRGIELGGELMADLVCSGEESQLRQVLGILVDNALRHTPDGGQVQLTLRRTDDAVLLEVADSGPGVPNELQEKIFERFYQADKSRQQEGSGLGLAIAKCIVERHGGEIFVRNREAGGAVFSVCLPQEE